MQLTPRYDGPDLLRFDMPIDDPSVPVLRQRRRLAQVLATLEPDQWSITSRCEKWSVGDVVAHLIGTNEFWAYSISSGLAGSPTRMLSSFDPASTPPMLVDAMGSPPPAEMLDRFVQSNIALAEAFSHLEADDWMLRAEAPPGHVSITAVALHALWDAWIHERDIMLPLGSDPTEEPDEVRGCLLYAAALGPAYLASRGSTRLGALAITASDPELSFVVDVGPTVVVHGRSAPPGSALLTGQAINLVEALSCRAPGPTLPEPEQWMLAGIPAIFDRDP